MNTEDLCGCSAHAFSAKHALSAVESVFGFKRRSIRIFRTRSVLFVSM